MDGWIQGAVPRELVAAAEQLLALDPVMAGLMVRFAPPAFGGTSLFVSLVRAVISQQISEAAAATIFRRLSARVDIEPARMLALAPEEFRACGISRAKTGYLHAIAEAELAGQLADLGTLADEEALQRLTQLKGVGRWTAAMILIFALGRDDVWASGDAGLRRAARYLYGVETIAGFMALGERFRPFRSHAAWYLWCYLDTKAT